MLTHRESPKAPHLLVHGFRLVQVNGQQELRSEVPNVNLDTLKSKPWTEVIDLLGSNGDGIIGKVVCAVRPFTLGVCPKEVES